MSDIDPAAYVENTTIRIGDLILIGEQVLNYVAAARMGRWASPYGVTDYGMPDPTMPGEFTRDFVLWTGGHTPEVYAEARDRALAFVQQSGWLDRCIAKVDPEHAA